MPSGGTRVWRGFLSAASRESEQSKARVMNPKMRMAFVWVKSKHLARANRRLFLLVAFSYAPGMRYFIVVLLFASVLGCAHTRPEGKSVRIALLSDPHVNRNTTNSED